MKSKQQLWRNCQQNTKPCFPNRLNVLYLLFLLLTPFSCGTSFYYATYFIHKCLPMQKVMWQMTPYGFCFTDSIFILNLLYKTVSYSNVASYASKILNFVTIFDIHCSPGNLNYSSLHKTAKYRLKAKFNP